MAHNETFVTWLRNAHAMEIELVEVLEAQAQVARDDYPEVRTRILQHVEETKKHAKMIEDCLDELDEGTSLIKSGTGKVMGWLVGLASMISGDKVVKNAIVGFTAEEFEIASYKALIQAATTLGHREIADKCNQILAEEEEMAMWLENNLPELVESFLEGKGGEHEENELEEEEMEEV